MGAAEPTPSAETVDLADASAVATLFTKAALANLKHPWRKGGTTHLPETGRVVMTGDLHANADNLRRILKLADLDGAEDHHVILHEVIHGPDRIDGRDESIRMLIEVAALKLRYPMQVHFLLANHELAQLSGEGILKAGVSLVDAYNRGVNHLFAEGADAVRKAMGKFIRSMQLAVKLQYGVMCSHSLPGPRQLRDFDTTVIDRVPTAEDLQIEGHAYNMVWGRRHTQDVADELGAAWDVDLFLMGHQPAEMGHEIEGESMIVLASDHDHGVALPIDLDRPYRLYDLVERITPLNSVVMSE